MSTTALAALVAVLMLAVPSAASAARGPASVTISSCQPDRLTVTGRVAVAGNTARKVRRATLEIRFSAMPLFGFPKTDAWRKLGRKTRASGQQEFTGLPAESWAGLMEWRFKRGRRAVLSGVERSQPVRVGRRKGRATCVVPDGLKPVDTVPPTLYMMPADDVWHRGPAHVRLAALDDFSGVQSVRYSVDGGPVTDIRNGTTFEIPGEGAHNVDWAATDVAGNTASRSQVVKVDASPPSKPVLSRPFSVTASTTPTFTWSASTDSASGVKAYFLAIRSADGSLVALKPVDANTTSVPSPATLTAGETYTATVTAVDSTDDPWAADSDPLTFRVDPNPDASASPASGTVLHGGLKDTNFTIALDRPADPATVSKSTVVLTGDPDPPPDYNVTCSIPCTTITVDAAERLDTKGRYSLAFGGVQSEEGLGFPGTPAVYAVPEYEDDAASTTTSCGNVLPWSSSAFSVKTTTGGETILGSFSYSTGNSAGRARIRSGTTTLAETTFSSVGTLPSPLSFTLQTAATHNLTFEYCRDSGSDPVGLSAIWVSRAP